MESRKRKPIFPPSRIANSASRAPTKPPASQVKPSRKLTLHINTCISNSATRRPKTDKKMTTEKQKSRFITQQRKSYVFDVFLTYTPSWSKSKLQIGRECVNFISVFSQPALRFKLQRTLEVFFRVRRAIQFHYYTCL